MLITEIRWIAGDRDNHTQSHRLPLSRGLNFIRGLPEGRLGHSLLRMQDELVYPAVGSLSGAIGGQAPAWQFVIQDKDLFYSFSTDQPASGRESFFRRSVIGGESAILGSRIDYDLLFGQSVSLEQKKKQLERLLSRLDEARARLWSRTQQTGKIMELRNELTDSDSRIRELEKIIATSDRCADTLKHARGHLNQLREEDRRLADDLWRLRRLAVKQEYEKLVALGKELAESREREGLYGSRITEKGHNITVREMTVLTGMQKEMAGLMEEGRQVESALDKVRKERKKAERERAITAHEIAEFEGQGKELAEKIRDSTVHASGNRGLTDLPSSSPFAWLLSALALALGLLLLFFSRTVGWLMIGLGVVALAVLAFRFGLGRLTTKRALEDRQRRSEASNLLRADYQRLSARLGASSIQLDRLERFITELDGRESELQGQLQAIETRFHHLESELMDTIRPYAVPSEPGDLDGILTALSRQRETSRGDSEAATDLERRIAELRHGRSEEEMRREYFRACEDLERTGTSLEGVDPSADASLIVEKRKQLSMAMEEAEKAVQSCDENLLRLREARIDLGGQARRRDSLTESFEEAVEDYFTLNAAVAWLRETLGQWKSLDPSTWLGLSARYLNRMIGRRPPANPSSPVRGGVRTPSRLGRVNARELSAGAAVPFAEVPQAIRYLALRLGLAAGRQDPGGRKEPLILIDPINPQSTLQADYLLNSLEEWCMETGRQMVYLTDHKHLIELIQERKMNLRQLLTPTTQGAEQGGRDSQ